MQSVPTTIPTRRTTSRELTVIIEGQYGHHQRLELLVTLGMTAADLHLDESHSRLVQPGGAVLSATEDLFEIAADTPKVFALQNACRRIRQPEASRQRRGSLPRLLYRGGRAVAAVMTLPRPRHGVAP